MTAILPRGLAAALICQPLTGAGEVAAAAVSPPAEVSKENPGTDAEPLPATPAELFGKLSAATRPQWRQFYRPAVNRCQDGRRQAAVALGAVCADLYLAAQARDAQQVRNLLQDEATIEKSLGLVEPMAKVRQRMAAAAEQGQWKELQGQLADLPALHLKHLKNQKDEDLADFSYIGQWMRCLQVCHEVVLARKLNDHRLAIGTPRLIDELKRRLEQVSDPKKESVRCLRLLHARLAGLEKLWREDPPAGDVTQRVKRSAELLAETMDEVIQDPPLTAE